MVAASKPTSSLSKQLHILYTQSYLGALTGGLGCFPLDNESYLTLSDCLGNGIQGIRSLVGFGSLVGPLSHSALYLTWSTDQTLALKLFRKEPAITGFD